MIASTQPIIARTCQVTLLWPLDGSLRVALSTSAKAPGIGERVSTNRNTRTTSTQAIDTAPLFVQSFSGQLFGEYSGDAV